MFLTPLFAVSFMAFGAGCDKPFKPVPVPKVSKPVSEALTSLELSEIEEAILYEHLLRENPRTLTAIGQDFKTGMSRVYSIKKNLLFKLGQHFIAMGIKPR